MIYTTENMQELIMDLMMDEDRIMSIQSFSDAGLLTDDHGIVLIMEDGSEFQIPIVQSKMRS